VVLVPVSQARQDLTPDQGFEKQKDQVGQGVRSHALVESELNPKKLGVLRRGGLAPR